MGTCLAWSATYVYCTPNCESVRRPYVLRWRPTDCFRMVPDSSVGFFANSAQDGVPMSYQVIQRPSFLAAFVHFVDVSCSLQSVQQNAPALSLCLVGWLWVAGQRTRPQVHARPLDLVTSPRVRLFSFCILSQKCFGFINPDSRRLGDEQH